MPPPHPAESGLRIAVLGVAANLALAAAKAVAGVLGNSYALIADAIESGADIAASLVLFEGMRIAARPPDRDHPYGHGKAEPLTAMVMGGMLLLAAGAIAVQAVREVLTPHHAPAPYTLVVLAGVVVIKEGLYRFVRRRGATAGSTALLADAWHHRSDALSSAAAGLGIAVALAGGEGYQAADDWAALAVSGLIAYNAMRIVRPAAAEAMDAAPPADVEASIRAAAAAADGVLSLDKCHVRKMGFDYYVDLHVCVDGALTVRRGHEIAHGVKDAILRSHPRVADVLVHVEPSD